MRIHNIGHRRYSGVLIFLAQLDFRPNTIFQHEQRHIDLYFDDTQDDSDIKVVEDLDLLSNSH